MLTVRIRLLGSPTDAQSLITELHGVEGVEGVEEVADLMPHMDDEDSSSAGLPDDVSPGVHSLEIKVRDATIAEKVRETAGAVGEELDVNLEFVDEF